MNQLLCDLYDGLRRGDAAEMHRTVRTWGSSDSDCLALFALALVAEREHDVPAMHRVLSSPDLPALRRFPARLADVATAAVWTAGIGACREVLDLSLKSLQIAHDRRCCLAAFRMLARRIAALERTCSTSANPVPAQFLRGVGVPLVKGCLSGNYEDWFIFDTGAPTTVISSVRADRGAVVRLHPYRTVKDASRKKLRIQPVIVPSIELGGVKLTPCTADVMKMHSRLEIGGIISPWDTLRGLPVELDFRRGQLLVQPGLSPNLWARNAKETVYSVPLTWDDGNPFVRVRVAGRSAWLMFNTGAAENLASPRLARESGFVSGESRHTFGAGYDYTVREGFHAPLKLGKAPIGETPFLVANVNRGGRLAPLDTMGSLGVNWMHGRRILLAADGTSISFTDVQAVASGTSR